jgi:tRNA(adenine34) deaminase
MRQKEMNRDQSHMQMALEQAGRALDADEFPVGCVIVYKDMIVTHGQRSNSRGDKTNELDHAEISALKRLLTNHPEIPPAEVTVYATLEPCLMCYSTMILNGVRRLVYAYEDAMGGGTDLDLTTMKPLYQQMKIEVIPHICRTESLKLFQKFFQNPDNDYWPDSLLAEYTLSQS